MPLSLAVLAAQLIDRLALGQVLSVGIWCMANEPCPGIEPDNDGPKVNGNHTYEPNCPWMYDELRAWRHRPTSATVVEL